MYSSLANAVALIHVGFILVYFGGAVVVLCGRLGRTWPLPFFQRLYLATAFLTCLSHVVLGRCVLTTWENCLRRLENIPTEYVGTFVDNYAPFIPGPIADWAFLLATLAAFAG